MNSIKTNSINTWDPYIHKFIVAVDCRHTAGVVGLPPQVMLKWCQKLRAEKNTTTTSHRMGSTLWYLCNKNLLLHQKIMKYVHIKIIDVGCFIICAGQLKSTMESSLLLLHARALCSLISDHNSHPLFWVERIRHTTQTKNQLFKRAKR